MTAHRDAQVDLRERIHGFVVAAESNELTEDHWARFERLLLENDDACRLYAEYMDVSLSLVSILDAMPCLNDAPSDLRVPEPSESAAPQFSAFPSIALNGSAGYLTGWPMAYLVATVIFAVGLAIAAFTYVSQPGPVASQPASLPSPHSPLPSVVARVTGMVDCVWEGSGGRVQGSQAGNHQSEIINHKSVLRLGDRLALRSGLLELTYDTGAKVILQGPVRYEIESPAGGYLSLGKLTARLAKGSGISANPKRQRGSGDEDNGNSPLSPLPSPLFAVRTPTALVTDLGTEFGVETDGLQTRSHVFEGEITVTPFTAKGNRAQPIRLMKGQSLVVDRSRVAVHQSTIESQRFVRSMPAGLPPDVPALPGGEVVFNETFDTNSNSPAAAYPNLTFLLDPAGNGGGKADSATVRDGILRLEHWDGGERTGILTARTFSGEMLVSVDIGGNADHPGMAHTALCLGDLVFLFHPGFRDGEFRAEVKGACLDYVGQDPKHDDDVYAHDLHIGFFPVNNVLHHLSVYYDGKETYQVCLINGASPHQVFRQTYKSAVNHGAAFQVGAYCRWGAMTGLFDNLRVIQSPTAKNNPTPDERHKSESAQVQNHK